MVLSGFVAPFLAKSPECDQEEKSKKDKSHKEDKADSVTMPWSFVLVGISLVEFARNCQIIQHEIYGQSDWFVKDARLFIFIRLCSFND